MKPIPSPLAWVGSSHPGFTEFNIISMHTDLTLPEHIKLINAPVHSEEWHKHRKRYIGASETGTILGINKWATRAKTWQEKSGQVEGQHFDNEPMYWGRTLEAHIATAWKHYDFTTNEYLENAGRGHIIRECIEPGGFLVNDKYPWLSAANDRIIPVGQPTMFGEILASPAPLEIKTVDHYAHNVNLSELPPYYEAQIMQQMIIIESGYAEFAYLVGGQKLKVEPREYNERFAEMILETTYDFWYNCVEPAKKVMDEILASPKMESVLRKKLVDFEPEIEDTEKYNEWLREQYKEEKLKALAPEGLVHHLIGYGKVERLVKLLGEISQKHKNHILKAHKDLGAGMIDFGEAGKSTLGKQFRINPAKSLAVPNEFDHIIGMFNI